MDIKIRTRLSAYSKVDSFDGIVDINRVPNEYIDTLFLNEPQDGVVTKSEINSLFSQEDNGINSVKKETIDTLFTPSPEEFETVTFAEIDSLFN